MEGNNVNSSFVLQVHVSDHSTVPDHCKVLALSDKDEAYHEVCAHEHNSVCQDCAQLDEVLMAVEKLVSTATVENQDIHQYRIAQAGTSIKSWKQHIVRARNQDAAKSNFLEQMSTSEVLVVLDWAMKYLPRRYREDQSNWFAKRGLNWHVAVVFHRTEVNLESIGFVHIFETQISQDAKTTTAVILDVINSIYQNYSEIQKCHLWSDNAGCYKSNETLNCLLMSGKVSTYNFCEAQDGKGACDRTAATIKSGIRRFVNAGNDVLSATQMKEVCKVVPLSVYAPKMKR